MKPANPGLLDRLESLVWDRRDEALPPWKSRGLRAVRTVISVARDLARGQLTLRAMGLVYTTLLSIVPLLALSFSVLKAFGVYNQLQPILLNFLAPLGEKGDEVADRIMQFIDNMNIGVLGGLGLVLLVYTSISLMQKIEEAFNYIWHIPAARRISERFSRYLSVLLIGPILMFSAMGLTATVMNIETVQELLAIDVLSQAVELITRLMPYLLVVMAFTFIYLFIPNTRVRFLPALAGGAAGGIAWQTAGWAFAIFVAASNKYSAIYSGLAIMVLFMIWLYLSWLILMFGASVSFYVQHPEYLYSRGGEPRLSNRLRERLALSVASLVAGRFLSGERPPSIADFTRLLGVPMHVLQTVIDALEARQIVVQGAEDPPVYLPGRDPSLISVTHVLETVRSAGEERFFTPEALTAPQPVSEVLARMQHAVDSEVGGMTLRDLAQREGVGRAQG